jgi:hypothetical protein
MGPKKREGREERDIPFAKLEAQKKMKSLSGTNVGKVLIISKIFYYHGGIPISLKDKEKPLLKNLTWLTSKKGYHIN